MSRKQATWSKFGRLITTLMIAISFAVVVQTAVGNLDPTFGDSGLLETNLQNHIEASSELIIQPDGKIVVAGRITNPIQSTFDLILARYNPDGSVDPTFGQNGIVTASMNTTAYGQFNLAIQDDEKILAAATLEDSIRILRYQPNGVLDTSFASQGVITSSIDNQLNSITGIDVQSDGKIVVIGQKISPSYEAIHSAVLRYTSEGLADTSFGLNGVATQTLANHHINFYDLAIQTGGEIVVVGESRSNTSILSGQMLLLQLNPNGTLDTTFSDDGILTTTITYSGDTYAIASGVQLQPDGKIIAAGTTGIYPFNANANMGFTLARYQIDGSLDTTFGTSGFVTTTIMQGYNLGKQPVLQADGKILLMGTTIREPYNDPFSGPSQFDAAILRYTNDGHLDTTFGTNGFITMSVKSDSDDFGHDIGIQEQTGQIIVLANSDGITTSHNASALWRFDTADTVSETIPNNTDSMALPSLTISNTSGGTCTVSSTKYPVPPGGTPADEGEMPIQWKLSTACDPFHGDLTFEYTDTELSYSNNVTETELTAFQSNNGAAWSDACLVYSCTRNAIDNSLVVHGVTDLNYWTVGNRATGITATVTVSHTGSSSITLAWGTAANHCDYTIYRHTSPYSSGVAITTSIATNNYVANGGIGDPSINYFYTLQANNCFGLTESIDSNKIGEFDFSLTAGQ